MDYSTPGFPVLLYVSEFVEIHVHWVDPKWSNHLILCWSLLILPSIFPSIRVFSSEWALPIRRPKYWSFSSVPGVVLRELYSPKFVVDLVFEDCFRKWESSENKDSKRNLNGFFNFLDNFSKYYLRWRPRLSELWFSCHNLPGSSVELNKTPLEIQDWNLSGAKGTVYSAYIQWLYRPWNERMALLW